MRSTCFGLVLLCSMGMAKAQATIQVGPGGFAQIDAALATAQPGDVVEVAAGTYEPFTATVGVRILANGAVTITGNGPQFTWYLTSMNVPAGQTLYVHGLTFASSGSTLPHDVRVLGGQVVFESCTFQGGHPVKVFQALDCAAGDTVLRHCTFSSGHRCVLVRTGSLLASDCHFLPYQHPTASTPPFGVEIAGGSAQFSFCEMRGANCTSSPGNGGSAIQVGPLGKLRLTDCEVTGGDATSGPPVPAIVNTTSTAIEHARGSVVGGFGYVWFGFTMWHQRGPDFVGPEIERALPGSLSIATGMQSGAAFGFACAAAPNSLVVVPLSFGLVPPASVPGVLDPIRFDPLTTTIPFSGATDPVTGLWLSPPIAVPNGLVGLPAWFHPVLVDGANLVVGVPVGGVLH